MYFRAVQQADIEVPAAAPAEDEAVLSFVTHLVEEPEALDDVRRLVPLPDAASAGTLLEDLPVVAARLLHEEHFFRRQGVRMPAYAPCVDAVALGQLMAYPCMLGDVPVCHMYHTGVHFFQPVIYRPPHDAHEGRVPE